MTSGLHVLMEGDGCVHNSRNPVALKSRMFGVLLNHTRGGLSLPGGLGCSPRRQHLCGTWFQHVLVEKGRFTRGDMMSEDKENTRVLGALGR